MRSLHALGPLSDFDIVIVDSATDPRHLEPLQAAGVNLVIAPEADATSESAVP